MHQLTIDGEVARPRSFSCEDVAAIHAEHQIPDVSRVDVRRRGTAVRLAGLLEAAQLKPTAKYLTLHSAHDDFHASIPLDDVRDKAIVIYELDGQPLPEAAGGPFRFFIPEHTECHSSEIDECANVKYVDRIELSTARGRDNRPQDEKEHAKLHGREA
jgi:DMSO/TMAO reductase YedYZ molybdopterin-dependent catalytic subunit